MKRIEPPNEPARFDEKCRRPGNQWLTKHLDGDPPAKFWRPFAGDLCRGFQNRCAYSAMWDLNGTVAHFLSRKNHRHLSYEWSNFRYVSGWLNSKKQSLDERVLDPFQVRDEWFEIILPHLIMRLTKCVPVRVRSLAQFTLRRLDLDRGDRIYEQRRIYYDDYKENSRPISWLEMMAPLVATAVRRERLLAALDAMKSVSSKEAAEICETSREHIRAFLRMWVRAEHLRSHGRGRGTRYVRY